MVPIALFVKVKIFPYTLGALEWQSVTSSVKVFSPQNLIAERRKT
jgi:hypothetical protein